MDQIKELKSIKPEFYVTDEAVIYTESGESRYKLLFSNDLESLMNVYKSFEFHKNTLQELRQHICIKVYGNKYHVIDRIKAQEIPMLSMFIKLNGLYDEQCGKDKSSTGISD